MATKYTESHEWLHVNGNIGTVGITDHAQHELGDIVFVELPHIGAKVTAGQEIVVLESTKAAADVYTPVSGTILTVNEALNTSPDLVNKSPMDQGWLFTIEMSQPQEQEALLDKTAYHHLIG